jgi:hypothetical protein
MVLRSVAILVAAAGCGHSLVGPTNGKCAGAEDGVVAAIENLRAEGDAQNHILESPRAQDAGANWNIWVARREVGFPGESLVVVAKSDCQSHRRSLK